jgi:hypothetical protein
LRELGDAVHSPTNVRGNGGQHLRIPSATDVRRGRLTRRG